MRDAFFVCITFAATQCCCAMESVEHVFSDEAKTK